MGRAKIAFLGLLFSTAAFGRVYELDFTGLSVHLGSGYAGAPRGLDKNGTLVFNPGIGGAIDFRDSVSASGFSPTVRLGMFQDCDDRTVFYGGIGARYSYTIDDHYLVGGGLSLFLANGEDWSTAERHFVLIPYPNLEFGVLFNDRTAARMSVAWAPGGSSISALSDSSLLFITFSVSFGPSTQRVPSP